MAATKVFVIVELAEHIFSHLPNSDVLIAMRVPHHFQDVINQSTTLQQKLFLVSAGDSFSGILISDTKRHDAKGLYLNPVLVEDIGKDHQTSPSLLPCSYLEHLGGVLHGRAVKVALSAQYLKKHTSADLNTTSRQILLTQPPVKYTEIKTAGRGENYQLWQTTRVSVDDGARFQDFLEYKAPEGLSWLLVVAWLDKPGHW